MGIPSYFSHLCRTYPEVIQEWKSQTIHNLYLDSNSIVYDSLRSLEYQGQVDFEQTLIEKVCETIDEYIIKYPYCHDGKKQKLKCKKIKGKY